MSKSLHNKVHIVLEVAQGTSVSSLSDLRAAVRQDGSPTFITSRYDADGDEFVEAISDRSIARAVSASHDLELVDLEGSLTAAGRRALSGRRYDEVLAQQVALYLDRHGVSLDRLNRAIRRALKATPVILPTARYLWEVSGQTVGYGTFMSMLTLLSVAGGADHSRGKLYLEFF